MIQRIAIGLLSLGVIVEGVSLVKLNGAVTRLSDHTPPAAEESPAATARQPERAPVPRGQVPVFSATAPPAAVVMETLASSEGRQKLQEVLSVMKEQRRQEKLVKSVDRRERLDQRMLEIVGAELGLNADENRKAHDTLARLMATRRHAVEELQSGLKTRNDAKNEIDNASRTADRQLEEILGDKRLVTYRDLRRKTDRALAAKP